MIFDREKVKGREYYFTALEVDRVAETGDGGAQQEPSGEDDDLS